MSVQMPEDYKRSHNYHASAIAISGHLRLPLVREIRPQAKTELHGDGGTSRSASRISASRE